MFDRIRPEDWTYAQYGYEAVDLPKVIGVKYVGDEESGTIETAATTGDITAKHGALSSEAADTTVGSSGVLDLTTYTTVESIIRAFNLSDNWEAWAIDFPGDYLTNISAGNGIFPTTSATQCKVAAGVSLVMDTSLKTAEDYPVGITFNGPSTNFHGTDVGVLHQIIKINANVTFGGATDGLYIYSCDDRLGTKTQIWHRALVSATATEFYSNGEPIISVDGSRIVVMAKDASGAITSPSLLIEARSYAHTPVARKSKLWSTLSI
jgi:hypothetical protein